MYSVQHAPCRWTRTGTELWLKATVVTFISSDSLDQNKSYFSNVPKWMALLRPHGVVNYLLFPDAYFSCYLATDCVATTCLKTDGTLTSAGWTWWKRHGLENMAWKISWPPLIFKTSLWKRKICSVAISKQMVLYNAVKCDFRLVRTAYCHSRRKDGRSQCVPFRAEIWSDIQQMHLGLSHMA